MRSTHKANELSRATIVTVCFKSDEVVSKMLGSVPSSTPVILIDNDSKDTSKLETLASDFEAILVKNFENKGFGTACNQGAALAKTEFILFLNPDTELFGCTIDRLLEAADRYPEASAFNPSFGNVSGRSNIKRNSPLISFTERIPRGRPDKDRKLPVLSGAALFIRREAFEEVGGFDPGIFLYHEDDDLSRRLIAQCGPLYFVRNASVTHLGGRSTPRNPETAALKAWHMGRSRVYVMKKHNRPFPQTQPLISALVQVCSPAVLFSARIRAKKFAFLKGVLSAITQKPS